MVVDSQLQMAIQRAPFESWARLLCVYRRRGHPAARCAACSWGFSSYSPAQRRWQSGSFGQAGDLERRGINELHVEIGHKLTGSLVRERLVDELPVYLAPQLLGPEWGVADLGPLASLGEAVTLDFHSVTLLGPDLGILARPWPCLLGGPGR